MEKSQSKVRIYEDNDKFWDLLWEKIDRAKHYACIATYDMDHKTVAGITMQKLTNAARRGVCVYVIIDDLNFYADKDAIRKLEEAGGVVIRNNPTANWHMHFFQGRFSRFFNRNHQKVKIVDDCQFIGSLNVANPYTGVRYGSSDFRDLNAFVQGHSTKNARHFIRDILLSNVDHHKNKLDPDAIKRQFDDFDVLYPEPEEPHQGDMFAEFRQESPPHKTEVSSQLLDMIKNAQNNIRII